MVDKCSVTTSPTPSRKKIGRVSNITPAAPASWTSSTTAKSIAPSTLASPDTPLLPACYPHYVPSHGITTVHSHHSLHSPQKSALSSHHLFKRSTSEITLTTKIMPLTTNLNRAKKKRLYSFSSIYSLDGVPQCRPFSFLAKFQNLKVVELRGHSTDVEDQSTTLKALSVLPHLETITDFELSDGPEVVSCPPGFPSLSHISICSGNPTNILAILQCISSPFLESFFSQDLVKGSMKDLLSCASLLVSKFSTTLHQVIFSSDHEYPVETVGIPLFQTLLRGLPNLRTFKLTTATDYTDRTKWPTMTDEQADRMTLAWPNMENLSLQYSLSFQSLKTITAAWPNLTSLTFSTLYIPTPDLQLSLPKPHNTLRKLFVSTFRQSDPAASPDDIARVIHSIFPELEVGFMAGICCEVMRGVVVLQRGY
ncbi:hypothetical protein JAAARDRAFT_39462, partial [Jaapia argillacea MUCL 33604]